MGHRDRYTSLADDVNPGLRIYSRECPRSPGLALNCFNAIALCMIVEYHFHYFLIRVVLVVVEDNHGKLVCSSSLFLTLMHTEPLR